MTLHGSRFSAGYQFPRTAHAPAQRGRPIDSWTSDNGRIRLTVSPLQGGRPAFMLDLAYDDTSDIITCREADGERARRAFQVTRDALAGGARPDHILGL